MLRFHVVCRQHFIDRPHAASGEHFLRRAGATRVPAGELALPGGDVERSKKVSPLGACCRYSRADCPEPRLGVRDVSAKEAQVRGSARRRLPHFSYREVSAIAFVNFIGADNDPRMIQSTAAPQISDKAAKRRRQLAWTQRWHDARRAARRPEPRDIDRCVAEAVAFLAYDAAGELRLAIDLRSVVDVTKLLLRERGYAGEGLRELIVKRIQPRAAHRDCTQFVNRDGVSDPLLVGRPRRGGEPWSDSDVHLINRVVRKLSSKAT